MLWSARVKIDEVRQWTYSQFQKWTLIYAIMRDKMAEMIANESQPTINREAPKSMNGCKYTIENNE
jgi:hypothetical protein